MGNHYVGTEHLQGTGLESKHGLCVHVKPPRSSDPKKRREEESKNFENALRMFKRSLQNEGWMKEIRAKEYFESKGQKNRREKAEQRRRHLKKRRLEALQDW